MFGFVKFSLFISMKSIYNNFLASLDNKKDTGFSGKKLTIISIMICIMYGHYKLFNSINWEQLFVSVLTIDFGTILTLFGLNITDKKLNTNNDGTN